MYGPGPRGRYLCLQGIDADDCAEEEPGVTNLLIQHGKLTVGDGCRGHLSPTVVVQLEA
jgi:hypothetical protein